MKRLLFVLMTLAAWPAYAAPGPLGYGPSGVCASLTKLEFMVADLPHNLDAYNAQRFVTATVMMRAEQNVFGPYDGEEYNRQMNIFAESLRPDSINPLLSDPGNRESIHTQILLWRRFFFCDNGGMPKLP
jgi:hypothetical protein